MNIRYAQDYVVGDIFDLGTFELSKDEIIEFSRKSEGGSSLAPPIIHKVVLDSFVPRSFLRWHH